MGLTEMLIIRKTHGKVLYLRPVLLRDPWQLHYIPETYDQPLDLTVGFSVSFLPVFLYPQTAVIVVVFFFNWIYLWLC